MKKHHSKKAAAFQLPPDHRAEGSYFSYTLGFSLSIIATLIPFIALQYRLASGTSFVILALIAAFMQLFVQLVLFLHLSFKRRSALNLVVFAYTAVLVITIVVGTLWIMHNLNRNMTQNVFPGDNFTPQAQSY